MSGAAVTPGQSSAAAQGTHAGNAPDAFAAQPVHARRSAAIARGGEHSSGAHDAAEVGAASEVGAVPASQVNAGAPFAVHVVAPAPEVRPGAHAAQTAAEYAPAPKLEAEPAAQSTHAAIESLPVASL
jgi:hypothetical protein